MKIKLNVTVTCVFSPHGLETGKADVSLTGHFSGVVSSPTMLAQNAFIDVDRSKIDEVRATAPAIVLHKGSLPFWVTQVSVALDGKGVMHPGLNCHMTFYVDSNMVIGNRGINLDIQQVATDYFLGSIVRALSKMGLDFVTLV